MSTEDEHARPSRANWLPLAGRASLLGFAAILIAQAVVPTTYLYQGPGPAINVSGVNGDGDDVLILTGHENYDSDTSLYMTTVSTYGNADNSVRGVEALRALIDSDLHLAPVRSMYSAEVNADQVRERSQQMMLSSQFTSEVAGYDLLDIKIPMRLEVAGISEDSRAHGKLEVGDTITAITVPGEDPVELVNFKDLADVLDRTEPGTEVTLDISRNGTQQQATFATIAYEPDATGWVAPGSRLSVQINPMVDEEDLEVGVEVNVPGIGGPSAGQIFALQIYDKGTDGSLAGDSVIAGTGTVALDGDVGPIGGIAHKLQGAHGEGATYFLAPALNCEETIGFEPEGMEVFAVRNLDDSLAAIEAINAGDTSQVTTCRDVVGVD